MQFDGVYSWEQLEVKMTDSESHPRMLQRRERFDRFVNPLSILERAINILPLRVQKRVFEHIRHISGVPVLALRFAALKSLVDFCGSVAATFEGVYLRNTDRLSLGDHVSIHPKCYFDASGGLTIGRDLSIAHGTTVMTTEHDY